MTDRLDSETIADGVLPALRPLLRKVTVLEETDSTNSELARLEPYEQHAHALLAEHQTGGRGRRERKWHSPAGGNVYFSLGWRFAPDGPPLSTLPLVVAVATVNALKRVGLDGHGIKWPNDILHDGRKLCGILVEMKTSGAWSTAIIGIGINVRMPSSPDENPAGIIDRPWTDVESHLGAAHRPCKRNDLVSGLLDQLLAALERYGHSGFESFRDTWRKFDLLENGPVTLQLDGGAIAGIARGVNDNGELLLAADDGETRSFSAGEVRVFRGIRAF